MCKEDITIGRQLVSSTTVVVADSSQLWTLCIPRPDRVSLVIGANWSDITNNATPLIIGLQDQADVLGVAQLTTYIPFVRLDVREYGQLVTGTLLAKYAAAGPLIVWITEFFLTVPLEDV